jgi:hypothetical protein
MSQPAHEPTGGGMERRSSGVRSGLQKNWRAKRNSLSWCSLEI